MQRFRRRLWRRLQNRLRLWRLRWLWMRRMRPGLVGSLRHWVRRRCRMLYILGRLSLLLAMAHRERAIRLLADHLGFSIVHSALLTASDMADIVKHKSIVAPPLVERAKRQEGKG